MPQQPRAPFRYLSFRSLFTGCVRASGPARRAQRQQPRPQADCRLQTARVVERVRIMAESFLGEQVLLVLRARPEQWRQLVDDASEGKAVWDFIERPETQVRARRPPARARDARGVTERAAWLCVPRRRAPQAPSARLLGWECLGAGSVCDHRSAGSRDVGAPAPSLGARPGRLRDSPHAAASDACGLWPCAISGSVLWLEAPNWSRSARRNSRYPPPLVSASILGA